MKNLLKNLLILACLVAILILPYFVFAQSPTQLLENTRTATGYASADTTSISELVGKIVNAFLSLLGIIFITLMLYAGYNWMTASGDESKLSRAKDSIRRAIIGLVIVIGSFAIWNFIFYKLTK